jgi:hypothetical protein
MVFLALFGRDCARSRILMYDIDHFHQLPNRRTGGRHDGACETAMHMAMRPNYQSAVLTRRRVLVLPLPLPQP